VRIKTNYKLNNFIKNKNVINYVETQALSWFGRVNWMTNDRMIKKTV
jgi:hypothetical protein